MYSIVLVVAQHALTHRSKGQKSRSHGYKYATVAGIPQLNTPLCCLRPLPAWVCMSIQLPVF